MWFLAKRKVKLNVKVGFVGAFVYIECFFLVYFGDWTNALASREQKVYRHTYINEVVHI